MIYSAFIRKKELKASEDRLEELSAALSKLRQEIAGELSDKIEDGLKELNFLDVKFAMEFRRLSHFTPAGYDEAGIYDLHQSWRAGQTSRHGCLRR